VSVIARAAHNESLIPENLQGLEGIASVAPILLTEQAFALIAETASLALKFTDAGRFRFLAFAYLKRKDKIPYPNPLSETSDFELIKPAICLLRQKIQ
jgi:hypothetical protein